MLDRNLIFVSGKGGTGKSAVAAAMALLGARGGRRVLALALTDHTGLTAHLGADEHSYEPVAVGPGLFLSAVDRARALDEYLKLQLRVPRAAPTRQITRALDILVDTAPGVREIVSIGKPVYEVWRGEWDLVVVDAPSTGQIASYLAAPQTITRLVPAGAVEQQAARLDRTLRDDQTGYVLVTTPAELPVLETHEAMDAFAGLGLATPQIVVNRVLDPLPVDAEAVSGLEPSPAKEAALLHLSLVEVQRRWLGELGDGAPALPFLFGLLTPGEVAARLADVFGELW